MKHLIYKPTDKEELSDVEYPIVIVNSSELVNMTNTDDSVWENNDLDTSHVFFTYSYVDASEGINYWGEHFTWAGKSYLDSYTYKLEDNEYRSRIKTTNTLESFPPGEFLDFKPNPNTDDIYSNIIMPKLNQKSRFSRGHYIESSTFYETSTRNIDFNSSIYGWGDSSSLFAASKLEHVDLSKKVVQYEYRATYVGVPDETTGEQQIAYNKYAVVKDILNISIPDSAFHNCVNLKTVKLPKKIGNMESASIGVSAFAGCSELTEINIPDNVDKICGGAFKECTNLTHIELPHTMYGIDDETFKNCEKLKTVKLPKNYKYISGTVGISAFYGCSELSEISLPDNTTLIAPGAFYNCTSLKSIKIPDMMQKIDISAFAGCSGLTEIVCPESLSVIGPGAFMDTKISNVTFNKNLQTIGDSAFKNAKLTTVTTYGSVYPSAFWGCDLKEINIYSYSYNVAEMRTPFKTSEKINKLTIDGIVRPNGSALISCAGNSAEIGLVDIGVMLSSASRITTADSIDKVKVRFGECAYYDVISASVGLITSPTVGLWHFSDLFDVNTIKNLELGTDAAAYTYLPGANAPTRGLYATYNPISNSSSLQTLTINDSVNRIGSGEGNGSNEYYAFGDNTSLHTIKLGKGINYIAFCAFAGCTNLTNLIVDNDIQCNYWPYYSTFTNLKVVITSSAFNNFKYTKNQHKLKEIILTKDVKSISAGALSGMGASISLVYEGTMAEWNNVDKGGGWLSGCSITTLHCSDGDITIQ